MPIGIPPGIAREPTLLTSRLRVAPSNQQAATWPHFAARWIIPSQLLPDLTQTLPASVFPPELAAALQTALQPDAPPRASAQASVPATPRFVIVPDASLLARFTPPALLAWHRLLATDSANLTSRWPLALTIADLADLKAQPGGENLVRRCQLGALPSPDPGIVILHDLWLLNAPLDAVPDALALISRLLAAHPLLAKVHIDDDDPATARAAAAYWQVNGRYRAIEPILQAVGAVIDRDRIDLLHLLPQVARGIMNTFPLDLRRGLNPLSDSATAAVTLLGISREAELPADLREWLNTQTVPIPHTNQFGDIVVFAENDTERWPLVYVYLTDGTVFGRAPTLGGPWGIWRLDEIPRLNPRLGLNPPQFYRPRATDDAVPDDFIAPPLPPAWLQSAALEPVAAGPWGRLWAFEISLAPSASFFAALPEPSAEPRWTFPERSHRLADSWLASPKLTPRQRTALASTFRIALIAADGSWTVEPPLAIVRELDPAWRAEVYAHLLPARQVTDYAQELRVVRPPSLGEVSEPLLAALQPLLYPRNQRYALADYGLVYHLTNDVADRIALLQTLCRTPARIVLLERPDPTEVPALAAYWSAAGRKDLGLLLDSFAHQSETRFLDLAHLLPTLPREYLNLFTVPLADQPTPSCYWSAFNFNRTIPDDSFKVRADQAGEEEVRAEHELRTHYRIIPKPERPGDIIAYYSSDLTGGPYHLCNYLAADLVFSRNGFGFQAPWCIMALNEVDALYLNGDKVTVRYYRLAADL